MTRRTGMGSHESAKAKKTEWLTPPELIFCLGPFDLDPCSPVNRPWPTAAQHYTVEDNGLALPWSGRVWCNPPYDALDPWLSRLADHGDGIALIFARTETEAFFDQAWDRADAALFIKGRLHFYHVDGTRARSNAGAPSVLLAYGQKNALKLQDCGIEGQYVEWQRRTNAIYSDLL